MVELGFSIHAIQCMSYNRYDYMLQPIETDFRLISLTSTLGKVLGTFIGS